uniref:Uncharacterized protein n=1 Tax=Eustigmatophyceae sp. Mont 10/10-1w TaxID=2506145 RepID=A0A410D224_9STRA|nr:hypothetical protein Ycf49 [Eustigmatophyceae sp. Mont 10/10-1w]QAA11781.1 hypothetical protein Ycf49 [Eustigmatophyceae sp. Mont 10/10-1w]
MINKLSFQTLYIHCLSIFDWIFCIETLWIYGYKLKIKSFLNLSTSLFLFFLSATCVLTWHYYYNISNLIWLVVIQSFLTLCGNISLTVSSRRLNDRI